MNDSRSCKRLLRCIVFSIIILQAVNAANQPWTPIVVKNVTFLGPQHNPGVTGVSRDGGVSVLLNGNILWLYDDTECSSDTGEQLSFVSNTAAYNSHPNGNVSVQQEFGVLAMGKDSHGQNQYAILADKTVGTGGWIPFEQDELDFNAQNPGKERVAIWPGTNPTPISPTSAFLYAPLVYVDAKPEDPSKQYQARGMTLISISAPDPGPLASRALDLLFPGDQVSFGGFAALLGAPSTQSTSSTNNGDRDVYLFGSAGSGLQVARVGLGDIRNLNAYSYFQPGKCSFSNQSPDQQIKDNTQIYLPGSFSSGSMFYSPYFKTYLLIYLDKMADSVFQIRFLDLDNVVCGTFTWIKGGKNGNGIGPDDAEATVRYGWSAAQILYASPPGKGGFNYDGFAHPEFFNRQYYSPWVSSSGVSGAQQTNDWYGAGVIKEADAGGDGRHLMLSWTSQEQAGYNDGVYQVMLAKVEFDDIPPNPAAPPKVTSTASKTATATATTRTSAKPSKQIASGIGNPNGASTLGSFLRPGWDSEMVKVLLALMMGLAAGVWIFGTALH